MKLLSLLKRNQLLLIGLLLCIPIVWPYLQPHFFHLHDFTHVSRLAELEKGMLDGQLPVRWSQNLGYGYGMPQFSFYGPLFYVEALFFRLFSVSFIWSIKLAVILQIVISFFALYKLGELLWGKWAGLLTGIAGIYAPYRLVDMYVRGAFAELSGMTCVALTLLAVVWWVKKPTWRNVVFVAASGAGIVLSHTLMALISAPFIIAWIGFWVVAEKRLRKYWHHIVVIGLLTFGMMAFFALPALLEKGYTQADRLTTGFSNYNHHFLYIRQLWQSAWGFGGSVWGPEDGVSFELGKTQLAITGLVGISLAIALIRKRKISGFGVRILTGILLLVSLFFTILKSKFIWDIIPAMLFIQFPWRFLSVAIILLAILVGSMVEFVPKKLYFPAVALLIGAIISNQSARIAPQTYLSNDTDLYYANTFSVQTKMSDIIPDFLPKSAQPKKLPTPVLPNQRFTTDPLMPLTVEVDRSNEFLITFNPVQSSLFTARIFDFPGWTLYLDGQELPHDTSPEGLIQATISATNKVSYISGRFNETPLRAVADGLTVVAVLAAFGLCYPSLKKKEI